MMLTPGTQIGSYQVLSLIGVGGMGEVYRARDTRLNRDVALKVLPEVFARDVQRMARFEREAKLLASLNHPNIAAIYGLEESGPIRALVMELVEGPNLAERIRGGAIPLDEALPIARQVADAVEYAHDKSVIHRDLKPANIKVKEDGTVKVLDFGLAKALSDDPTEGDMSNSPTLSMAATRQGVILGTAAYMSPEQAKGKQVDRRTDVWAFGAVLYEMLTGKQAFHGDDITEVLAAVVKTEPDWTPLPPATPTAIRTLLRRCLEKNLRQRLAHIGEARILIEGVLTGAAPAEAVATASHNGRERIAWATAALLLVSVVVLGVLRFREAPPEQPATRLSILPPEEATLAGAPVISPDGRKLAFVGRDANGQTTLWIRLTDALAAQPLPGTTGAGEYIFWSPDSRFLAFFAEGKLKKIDITGGPPIALCDTPPVLGGAWSDAGVILLGRGLTGLYRVTAAGGSLTPLTTPDPLQAEASHRFPDFLPDGDHFLFRVTSLQPNQAGIYLGSLNSDEKRFLFTASSNARYVPPGYVLFLREDTLMAQSFDAQQLQLSGEAFPMAEDVPQNGNGFGSFSASENGVLAYASGSNSSTHFVWVDRAGRETNATSGEVPTPLSQHFALSPDEERVTMETGGGGDIWLLDLTRRTNSRFTFDPGIDGKAIWSPDGNHLVFSSTRAGKLALYRKASTGAGQEELIVPLSGAVTPNAGPTDWSRDGRFILAQQLGDKTKYDLVMVPLSADRKPVPYLESEFDEGHGRFSPDGRWVAYASNESGRPEVYVQSFPASGGKWQVSTGGGMLPQWRADGEELFYLVPATGRMMSAEVKTAPQFEVGMPKLLFTAPVGLNHNMEAGNHYAVSADGQRFLLTLPVQQSGPAPITVVLNWTAGLNK
jgi:Tol biopolymer transport system component